MYHNLDRDLRLPDEFADDLRRVDEQMWRVAGTTDHPAGLTQRVFDASLAELPAHTLRLADREMTPTQATTWWSNRFAVGIRLAAAIALVLIAGLYVLNTQDVGTSGGAGDGSMMASRTSDVSRTVRESTEDVSISETDGDEWLRVLLASADQSAVDATYLIDTQDARYADVHSELNDLIRELGM